LTIDKKEENRNSGIWETDFWSREFFSLRVEENLLLERLFGAERKL